MRAGRPRPPLNTLQLEWKRDRVVGSRRLFVERREVVVVHVGDDGRRARVLQRVLDRHLRLAFREPDELGVDVTEVDRRFRQRMCEADRIGRARDVPAAAVRDRVRP